MTDQLREYEERLHDATHPPTAEKRDEVAMLAELTDQAGHDAYCAAWLEAHLGEELAGIVREYRACSYSEQTYILAVIAGLHVRRVEAAADAEGEEWKNA
jgi:hypothetical protein